MNTIKFKITLSDNIGTKKFFLPFFWDNEENHEWNALLNILSLSVESETFDCDKDDFKKAVKDTTPWEEIPQYPYIRYRIGKMRWNNWDIFGIWVLYETNWGDDKRGYVVPYDDNGHVRIIKQEDYEKAGTHQPQTPYISDQKTFFEARGVDSAKTISSFLVKYPTKNDNIPLVSLEVMWNNALNTAIPVDLVVDLGNTRTVALLMEPEAKLEDFCTKCYPVVLDLMEEKNILLKGADFNNAVIDSWFLLCKPEIPVPVFENWILEDKFVNDGQLGKKYVKELKDIVLRKASSFVQMAPVVSGNEATKLYFEDLAKGYTLKGTFEQSSPKRYYWHDEPMDTAWLMLLHKSNPEYMKARESASPQKLEGDILYFMPSDGRILENTRTVDLTKSWAGSSKPENPKHPKSSTVTWFLVHILEKAWNQLVGIHEADDLKRPKYLARVLGTYPSGWTSKEIEMYRRRWQQAVDIFYRTHFEGISDQGHPYHPNSEFRRRHPNKPEIELKVDLNEAVAGQMPFVVSEINEIMKDEHTWLEITGKGDENQKTTRIMNIDIGGGTSDIAVIEYSALPNTPVGQAGLCSKVLSTECFTIAGDDVVKDIIMQVLMPQLEEREKGDVYKLSDPTIDPEDERRRVRAVRGCLIPVVNTILNKIKQEPEGRVTLAEAGCTEESYEPLRELLDISTKLLESVRFDYSIESKAGVVGIQEIIRKRFEHMLTRCACYACMYDVDYVFVSGKPSELPAVLDMIQEYTGLPLERIIAAKDYLVGSWYPFSDSMTAENVNNTRKISDAKSVTAVGCALYNALETQQIEGWNIETPSSVSSVKNSWSTINEDHGRVIADRGGELLNSQQDEMSSFKQLQATAYIGRCLSPLFDYEPVYKFCPKDPNNDEYPYGVKVKFKRSDTEDTLELVEVQDLDKNVITDKFVLKIWPCIGPKYKFWQDNGLLK